MTLIDNAVTKLFGKDQHIPEVGTTEYMKFAIKNAPDALGKYHEYTSDDAIKNALFEHTDISKYLKSMMEDKDGTKE